MKTTLANFAIDRLYRGEDVTPAAPSNCPHCGRGEKQSVRMHMPLDRHEEHFGEFRIVCVEELGGCGGSGPWRRDFMAAIAAWNRRTPHPNGCCCAACRAKVM